MKLTVKQTAELFNVSRAAVYLWIKNGLPYEKEKIIGLKERAKIDPEDVKKHLRLTEQGEQ